mgnify:CR=1 FL=1
MSIRDTVTGVQHVGIPTTDLEGTIAYYERLGFECLGIYPNGEDRCTFLRLNNLTLEVWTMDPTPMENGAINHFALDSTDIEASFAEAQKLGLNFAEGSIQHIRSEEHKSELQSQRDTSHAVFCLKKKKERQV